VLKKGNIRVDQHLLHSRNKPDEILKTLADRGAYFGSNFQRNLSEIRETD